MSNIFLNNFQPLQNVHQFQKSVITLFTLYIFSHSHPISFVLWKNFLSSCATIKILFQFNKKMTDGRVCSNLSSEVIGVIIARIHQLISLCLAAVLIGAWCFQFVTETKPVLAVIIAFFGWFFAATIFIDAIKTVVYFIFVLCFLPECVSASNQRMKKLIFFLINIK
ncbi:hypothetical protein ACKWTF_015648 [Chironomus riparius]